MLYYHILKISNYNLQILQCLSVQGLTSSGGGSVPGLDGGNSSGVSRALIKDRLLYDDFMQLNLYFSSLIFYNTFIVIGVLLCYHPGSRFSICSLRNCIKDNLNGQFPIPSYGSL